MVTVCLFFQMHQPLRLRRYSVFDTDRNYFDAERNAAILRRVAERSYIPLTTKLLELTRRHHGAFAFSMSVSGTLIEQLKRHAPSVIDLLAALADTDCVEFLAQPYHQSLSFLYSRDEFRQQVRLHAAAVQELFGQSPNVFVNTELIYNNDLASYVDSLQRYKGILTEGADHVLEGRTPNEPYRPPHCPQITLLLRNYRLSDDIAFRFADRNWSGYPLTAQKFADSLTKEPGRVCNLFVDSEAFGEHIGADTGIFEFLDAMPAAVLESKAGDFKTVGGAIDAYEPTDELDSPNMISWADTERDLSAWLGNAMQSNALQELYKLESPVKGRKDDQALADWRRLTTSDHFYYMCTKYFADGDVHRYFNPYESPYDSYINFMNVLDNLRTRVSA